jgi:hypothetical protein
MTTTLYSYQRSTVFAHPMSAKQAQALIDASDKLDVWPIRAPGKRKGARMRAHRHPFQGVFYVPVSLEVSA